MVVAWVATGFVVGIVQGILRASETPISSGMGSLAGPATFGGSMRKVFLRGLAGPFGETNPRTLLTLAGPLGSEDAPAAHIATGIYVAAPALAVELFFIPYLPATQSASKTSRILELLFPGASPAWGPLAGLAPVAWVSLLLQGLLIYKIGSPFILTSIVVPSPSRACGLPPAHAASVFQILNPGWVYLAPLVLFVVNLVLILASRWKMARAS